MLTHLSLEQCQELKRLGFPQKYDGNLGCWFLRLLSDGYEWYSREEWRTKGVAREYIPCPTLEELIDWLGDDLHGMSRAPRWMSGGNDQWQAMGISKNTNYKKGYGKTPLEAVYNLTVALKSPNTEA